MLKAAIRCDEPVFVIEHRWLYDAEGGVRSVPRRRGAHPMLRTTENGLYVAYPLTGVVVPNDESAWLAALTELLDDFTRRQKLGAAARAKILSHYAVPAQAETYVRLFS